MGREFGPGPLTPPERVEVSGKHLKLRFILMILFLVLGIAGIGYGISSALSQDPGWMQIQADNSVPVQASADLDFEYCLGQNATAEAKLVTAIYTKAVQRTYQVYHPTERFTGVGNLCAVNKAPNRDLTVEPELYRAFEAFLAHNNRALFLAPVYAQYDAVFRSTSDEEAAFYDPMLNAEAADYVRALMEFISDPEAISLSLLGENRVRLNVRSDYLKFAEEYGIEAFLDFYWMKNAFVLDDLADRLVQEGHVTGYIASSEGFCRYLDPTRTEYTLELMDRRDGTIYYPARLHFHGPMSLVSLHAYGPGGGTGDYFYQTTDGTVRTPYLDTRDGTCKAALQDLSVFSETCSCSELLLSACPAFIAEKWEPEAVLALHGQSIHSVWCENQTVFHTELPAKLVVQDKSYSDQLLPS